MRQWIQGKWREVCPRCGEPSPPAGASGKNLRDLRLGLGEMTQYELLKARPDARRSIRYHQSTGCEVGHRTNRSALCMRGYTGGRGQNGYVREGH